MTAVAEQTGAWLAEFNAQAKAEKWVQALRASAFERFATLGFPTTRDEEWRFTNVAPIARANWKARRAAGASIPEAAQQHLAKHAAENAFTALNTAFLDRIHFVEIPRGKVQEEPIEITYDSSAAEG